MSYRGALWLEREDRYYEERPDLVLQAMALEPGDVVADIGTGSGYYARQIAPLVAPGGRVLAVDIQPQMLKFLSQLVEEEGVTRVEPILSEPDDPKLPAGEVDWILLADVYHEIAAPERVLSKMREALAPDGRVALLEYRVEDGTGDRVKADHTMSVRQVLSEWKPAGFDLVALNESLPMQHLFVFAVEGGEHTIEDVDFLDALDVDAVEAEIESSGALRIRRKTARPIVVTLPVGTYLEAPDGKRSLSCPKTRTNSSPASAGAFRIDAPTLTSPREARMLRHGHADPTWTFLVVVVAGWIQRTNRPLSSTCSRRTESSKA